MTLREVDRRTGRQLTIVWCGGLSWDSTATTDRTAVAHHTVVAEEDPISLGSSSALLSLSTGGSPPVPLFHRLWKIIYLSAVECLWSPFVLCTLAG